MNKTEELLSQLRDINQPAPPESGFIIWNILAVILGIILLAAIAIKLFNKYCNDDSDNKTIKNHPWTQQIQQARIETATDARIRLARLLRHICLNTEKTTIQDLTGIGWLEHLDNKFATNYFTCGEGIIFGDAMYKPVDANTDINAICDSLELFVKKVQA